MRIGKKNKDVSYILINLINFYDICKLISQTYEIIINIRTDI
jgi:hypothetical protein